MLPENAIRFTLYPDRATTRSGPPSPGADKARERPLDTGLPPPQAQACGKAIILGEHAVVYGAEAIAMPIPTLTMELTLRRDDSLHGAAAACSLGQNPAPEPLAGVVEDAFRLLAIKPFAVRIEGRSTIMIGSGLGSSAAVCVVILKALAASQKRELPRAELARLANELEKRFHGTPSGLDTAVVAYQRVIAFRKGPGASSQLSSLPVFALPRGDGAWHFALIDSQVRSSTLSMISLAAPYFQGKAGGLRLQRFDALAREVKEALSIGHELGLSAAMNEAASMLQECGVTSPLLAEMLSSCRSLGIPAAKPTGAGGGGCILALLDASRRREQLLALSQHFGAGRVVPVALPACLPGQSLGPPASRLTSDSGLGTSLVSRYDGG